MFVIRQRKPYGSLSRLVCPSVSQLSINPMVQSWLFFFFKRLKVNIFVFRNEERETKDERASKNTKTEPETLFKMYAIKM